MKNTGTRGEGARGAWDEHCKITRAFHYYKTKCLGDTRPPPWCEVSNKGVLGGLTEGLRQTEETWLVGGTVEVGRGR